MIYYNLQYSKQYGHSPAQLNKKKSIVHIFRNYSCKISIIIVALGDGCCHKGKKEKL